MNNLTLYETTAEIDALMERLDSGETVPDEEMALIVGQHMTKVDRFHAYLANLEHIEDAAAAEIKRLQERKQRAAAHRERLIQYAMRIMEERGLSEMQGETSGLKIKQNPPAVYIFNEAEIPAEFQTIHQSITLDKNGIKARLKAGGEVPGATLVRGKRLVRE